MRVLVTGAAGRLGSATVEALLEAGLEVRCTDLVRPAQPIAPFEHADLTDLFAAHRVVRDVDAVVQLANNPNPNHADVREVFHKNVAININVFHAAVEAGVRQIVYASSIQTIAGSRTAGDRAPSILPGLPMPQNLPHNPRNYYSIGKVSCEIALEQLCRWHGLRGFSLRLPWLIPDGHHEKPYDRLPGWMMLDEALAWLATSDAGRLIVACLKSNLPEGHSCYLPTGRGKACTMSWEQIIAEYFPAVPVHADIDEIDCLVDRSLITQQTGWTPLVHRREFLKA